VVEVIIALARLLSVGRKKAKKLISSLPNFVITQNLALAV